MRLSPRIAPIAALACAATAGGFAVLSSRAGDWRQPAILAVLFAFAVVADRFTISTRTGATLACNLPVFVLPAALFGPAPAAAVAVAASLTQPRKSWELVAGDLAVFATFPLVTGLAVDALDGWVPGDTSLWAAIVVAGAYLFAWLLNLILVLVYMKALRGRAMLAELRSVSRALLSTQLALALG